MRYLPHGDWDTPGAWTDHKRDDGSPGAILICPLCRRGSVLPNIIDDAGIVIRMRADEHAVQCPTPGCLFNDDLHLVWWRKDGIPK